ncbi:MAG: hypothetical protein J0L56_18240 [Chitinophagales bacterium]|nr:hypothetical protein [Chitinophagales bacterium]
MKNKPSIWVVVGIGTGTSAGVALNNIPAGVTLGAAMGILTMLVSFTTAERKK